MSEYRIERHPILTPRAGRNRSPSPGKGRPLTARRGETISSALFAHGERIFSYHPKDHAPQGIFCANGQCAQCLVLADGLPVKSCMELVRPGMARRAGRRPARAAHGRGRARRPGPIEEIAVPVLIIGGGPAGLSAAIELGKRGIETLLVDDKHRLGGKLVLQTHRFFGSYDARLRRNARHRHRHEARDRAPDLSLGRDLAPEHGPGRLQRRQGRHPGRGRRRYVLIQPRGPAGHRRAPGKNPWPSRATPCPASTARAPSRPWSTATSSGRPDGSSSSAAGNVGLIAGYHALQAGIPVVGLVEALPECSGYKVHKDKLPPLRRADLHLAHHPERQRRGRRSNR